MKTFLRINERYSIVLSPITAAIPLTDCCHEVLPIQFVIDPGEDFVWGKDDLNPAVIQKLTITNHDKIGLLNEYLDVMQVCVCVLSVVNGMKM